MRGQVSTWLSLENGAGQGTLLIHTLIPLPCCPGARKELQSFLDSPQPLIEPQGSSKVPSKNVELAEIELPSER